MATTTPGSNDWASDERQHDRSMRMLAWGIAIFFTLAALALLLTYDPPDGTTRAAERSAAEFVAALEAQGLTAPDEDVVARVYGSTGGRACELTGSDEDRAIGLLNAQQTGEVNRRPAQLDRRTFDYQRTMVQTYCPDQLDDFDAFVRDLRLRRLRDAP
jgi:hypothetical protein